MSYVHNGKSPCSLVNDPIDPDAEDWIFFSYGAFLRQGETITDHEASITGGQILTQSTLIGSYTDECEMNYTNVYGIKFKASAGASQVTITERISTAVSGDVNTGRTNIDRTVLIPVRSL